LEAGEPAPYAGFLLTKRMLIILYEEASTLEVEEAADRLRDMYGRE
jgi:hypothetical protein